MIAFITTKFKLSGLFGKNKAYYPSRYYYHAVINRHNNGLFYARLIRYVKNTKAIKTDTKINLLKGKNLKDITVKDIRGRFGRFNNKIINDEFFEVKVLFYKHRIGKFKAKMEFHFYKNKLFFYAYTFSYLGKEEKEEVIQTIKAKYLKGETVGLCDKYIVDENNNIMIVNDTVEFSIYYLCNNQEAIDSFMEYFKNKSKLNQSLEIKHKSTLYRRL